MFFLFSMISSSGFEAQCVFECSIATVASSFSPKYMASSKYGFDLLAYLFVFLWYMPKFDTNVEVVCVKLTSLHATSSERKLVFVYPPLIQPVVFSSGQVIAFLRCGSAFAPQAHYTLVSLLASGRRGPIHVASGKRSVHWRSSTRPLAMVCWNISML